MSRLKQWAKTVPGATALVRRMRTLGGSVRHRLVRGGHYRRLGALRGIHQGRRGWVIGNGPSLRTLDLSGLAGEVTFGCNAIWLLFEELDWRPTYYCVEDYLVAEDDAETINGLSGMTKIFPRDLARVLIADDETVFVNLIRSFGPQSPRFSDRCDRAVYWGGTVAYMMLQLAHWVGCNPIYLIGMDMTYQIHGDVDGTVITSREADMNHFHPEYFGPGKRWHLPRVDRMQTYLSYAARWLEDHGVEAFNATPGGNLLDFRRAEYRGVLDS